MQSRRTFLQAGAAAMAGSVLIGAGRAMAVGRPQAVGLRTAFVVRPLEYGKDRKPDLQADSSVDITAKDFNDLADRFGA